MFAYIVYMIISYARLISKDQCLAVFISPVVAMLYYEAKAFETGSQIRKADGSTYKNFETYRR